MHRTLKIVMAVALCVAVSSVPAAAQVGEQQVMVMAATDRVAVAAPLRVITPWSGDPSTLAAGEVVRSLLMFTNAAAVPVQHAEFTDRTGRPDIRGGFSRLRSR